VFPEGGSVPTGLFLANLISCSSGSSLAYVLCSVYRRNVQSGLRSASGSGCKLDHILCFLSIYLIIGGGACSMLWMVLNVMSTVVCLNRFVMEWTSRPTYANFAQFCVFPVRDHSGSYSCSCWW
jgi:hypothetical protein